MDNYIDLQRAFLPYSKEESNKSDDNRLFGSIRGDCWDDILSNRRLAILAEPGTGKTEELRSQTHRLRENEKPSFFCKIEMLQERGLEGSFDIGTKQEFDAWLSGKDHGYFFLDSVDEARLVTHKAYEVALRNFAESVKAFNFNRITVVVSCRLVVLAFGRLMQIENY